MVIYVALADINCYVCDATDEKSLFQCGEWFERYDDPQIKPQNCSNVHGARYCIKHIGRFEGKNIFDQTSQSWVVGSMSKVIVDICSWAKGTNEHSDRIYE